MQLSVAQWRSGGYVGGGRPLGGRTLVIGGSRYPGAVSADGWQQRSALPLWGLHPAVPALESVCLGVVIPTLEFAGFR